MFSFVISILALLVAIICAFIFFSTKDKKNRFSTSLFGLVALVISVVAWLYSAFFTVGAGEVGVKFDPLNGGVQNTVYGQGLHVKAPWQIITIFNVKTQSYTMSVIGGDSTNTKSDVIRNVTKEGLYVGLDITVLYSIDPGKAPIIKQTLGDEGVYQDNIVRPAIRSTIRNVIALHTAEEVYSSEKKVVETEILTNINSLLNTKNIQVTDVLLRDVELPEQLTTSITAKLQAQQDALAMQYILQKAEQEKQRKVIEAEGIAEANEVIAGSLTSSYLHWYWLDKLDKSNSVIYVPTEGGLPLFKNIDEVPSIVTTPVAENTP